jgi:hypothetical protein
MKIVFFLFICISYGYCAQWGGIWGYKQDNCGGPISLLQTRLEGKENCFSDDNQTYVYVQCSETTLAVYSCSDYTCDSCTETDYTLGTCESSYKSFCGDSAPGYIGYTTRYFTN